MAPDLTQAYFWPSINKGPSCHRFGYFFDPTWWDFFWTRREKNWKFGILGLNFPDPKFLPRPITNFRKSWFYCWFFQLHNWTRYFYSELSILRTTSQFNLCLFEKFSKYLNCLSSALVDVSDTWLVNNKNFLPTFLFLNCSLRGKKIVWPSMKYGWRADLSGYLSPWQYSIWSF